MNIVFHRYQTSPDSGTLRGGYTSAEESASGGHNGQQQHLAGGRPPHLNLPTSGSGMPVMMEGDDYDRSSSMGGGGSGRERPQLITSQFNGDK